MTDDTKTTIVRTVARSVVRIAVCAGIVLVIYYALRCYTPLVQAVVPNLGTQGIPTTDVWLVALAGLYTSAVVIAGIIGLAYVLRDW